MRGLLDGFFGIAVVDEVEVDINRSFDGFVVQSGKTRSNIINFSKNAGFYSVCLTARSEGRSWMSIIMLFLERIWLESGLQVPPASLPNDPSEFLYGVSNMRFHCPTMNR